MKNADTACKTSRTVVDAVYQQAVIKLVITSVLEMLKLRSSSIEQKL